MNGDYTPENCKWVTWKEQANNRSSNHFITYLGKKMTIMQASEQYGIDHHLLYQRISNGWKVADALFTPPDQKYTPHLITWHGKTQRLADWARELGMTYTALQRRINQLGWSIDEAFTTPLGCKRGVYELG